MMRLALGELWNQGLDAPARQRILTLLSTMAAQTVFRKSLNETTIVAATIDRGPLIEGDPTGDLLGREVSRDAIN